MSQGVDMELLKRRLESRFGLKMSAESETIDGGIFPVIRLADLERGTGFCIVVARTHRQLEASFRADNFAASLLRKMSEADHAARATFEALATQARDTGAQVYVAINGNPAEKLLPDNSDPWKKVELDVNVRLPSSKLQVEEILNSAVSVSSNCLSMALALLLTEETEETSAAYEKGLPEGARTLVEVNRYERSPANRAACVAHYGTKCQACGFDFFEVYGELGDGYIEVHHRIPVSQMGEGYFVNPILDLVPLCGNCHSMAHRSDPPMSVEKLRYIVAKRRNDKSAVQPTD